MKRAYFTALLLFLKSNITAAFSQPLHRPFAKFQSHHKNVQRTSLSTSFEPWYTLQYKQSYLPMQDLDRADGFPEGEALAKELYELIELREFREQLQKQEQEETFKQKRAINRQDLKLGSDISKPQFSPFSTNRERGEASSSSFFMMGPIYDVPGTSRGGGYSSTVSMNQQMNVMETSERSDLAQMGFVIALLAFYLYVGITYGHISGGEEAVTEMNTYFQETTLEDGLNTQYLFENILN